MKKINMILCAFVLIGSNHYANASDPISASDAHVLIQEIVSTISKSADAKSAQTAICKEGGIFRRSSNVKGRLLPVVAYNCESYDFFNYALLMCSDYPGFSNSTCYKKGTEIFKKRGETPNVDNAKKYISQAIKDKKVDPSTLACSTPRVKLMSELKNVADSSCNPSVAPAKQQTNWQSVKPSASAAGSKITIGKHRLSPPVTILQSALSDLPSNDASLISDFVAMQSSITDVLSKFEMKSAVKTGPVKGKMLEQETALVDQYESNNTSLSKLKVEVESKQKKNMSSLLNEAKKLSEATKKLVAIAETSLTAASAA
ncbi:MAG: hypothetical protein F9K49_06780 [Caedimonadaceae bacterium]|nr:MAG: hypothetical protein F9K49_06780 [Caedimonadaceae bacterium]